MVKFISGVVIGIFVGAVAVEMLERRPELVEMLKLRARGAGDRVRDAAARVDDTVRGFWAVKIKRGPESDY